MEKECTGGPTRKARGIEACAVKENGSMTALLPATQLPDCAPLPTYDWVELNTDDQVIIRTADGITAGGQVDVVADDASIFWVWLEGGGGRVAVHEEDDTQVWKAIDHIGTPKAAEE